MMANILQRSFLLLMAFTSPIYAPTTTCNQYPRFIGGTGTSVSTIFYHMDVASDQFAVVGKTNDPTIITGSSGATSSFYPYIVVQSIATNVYKWTKVFTQRAGEHLSQVAYSSNGQYLVVHGCCSPNSPIYVLQSSDGGVISSLKYSNSMQDSSWFHRIRTILIDNNKNAYILNQIKASASSSCQGQNLLKFSAVSPSSPLWSLTDSQDCKPFALKFGRDEKFVYTYGLQKGVPSVSLISHLGIVQWTIQHGTDQVGSHIVDYYPSTSDMIVFTTGESKTIYYNVLHSKTTSPFQIDSSQSKQYSAELEQSKFQIVDFKIISATSLRQLSVEISSGEVKVSTINLSNSKISYDGKLPNFNNPISVYGRFIPSSAANYLVGGHGTSVNTNGGGKKSSSFSFSPFSAFVMTSDVAN